MRRLSAAIAAAVLVLFGSVVLAGAASADPITVTITAPGDGGEDTTPLIEGTSNVSPVHVTIDGQDVATVTTDPSGDWSYQVTAPLAKGTTATITAEVRDGDGTVLGDAQHQYYCWPEPVSITMTSPASGTVVGPGIEARGVVDGTNRNLAITLTLDGKVIEDRVPFDDIDAGTVVASTILEGITDGPHTLQFVGTDDNGRTFTSQEVAVIGDGTPPKAPVLLSPANGSTVTTKHFTFHGTGTPGDTVYVMNDRSGDPYTDRVVVRPDGTFDAPIYASSKPPFNPLDGLDGQRRTIGFLLVEVDPVGNENSSGFSLTVDLRKPVAAAPKPATPKPATPKPAAHEPTSKPAGSAIPAAASADPASELANTGSSTAPGSALALLLIAVGLGLHRASRKVAPART